ncbi:MAG: hypothetical protein H8E86_03480 [Planctomycetes bacterium]|nr:hypothetical protein [Planctomycetota bacterium]
MSTTETQSETTNDLHIAIVHQIGTTWHCLFAILDESGTPSIQETIAVEDDAALNELVAAKSPANLYAVLQGSDTVCRTTTLPDVEDDQIIEALRLQAEAKLLGGTPAHRRALAPLDGAVGETNRVGLIVTWPESSSLQYPKCLENARFIPDAVALAALLDGLRPTEPLIYADPQHGTVTIALSHANGAALRATREIATSRDSFTQGILRTANETAVIHNHSDSFTQSMNTHLQHALAETLELQNILLLPDVIIDGAKKRFQHIANIDNAWWNTWGISIGALLAATGSLQALTTMQQHAVEVHPSPLEKIALRLENRTFATRLIVAAVLALALGPAILSGTRLAVLTVMNPNIQTQYSEAVLERKQHVVYKELAKSAWPMTKLISDITNNVPIGVDINSLQIDVGEPISIRGRAINADGKSAAELIALLQENLQFTGIYKDIEFSYNPAGTYGDREFDLWATVSDSLKRPTYKPEKDFGRWTLAMRQAGMSMNDLEPKVEVADETETSYSENASPLSEANADTIPENTDTPAFTGDHADRERTDRSRPIGRESGAKSHSDARDSGSARTRVPDPLSPELIKTMSRDETNIALKDVTEGLKRIGRTDPDTKKRLRTEMRLLLDRLKEVPE